MAPSWPQVGPVNHWQKYDLTLQRLHQQLQIIGLTRQARIGLMAMVKQSACNNLIELRRRQTHGTQTRG